MKSTFHRQVTTRRCLSNAEEKVGISMWAFISSIWKSIYLYTDRTTDWFNTGLFCNAPVHSISVLAKLFKMLVYICCPIFDYFFGVIRTSLIDKNMNLAFFCKDNWFSPFLSEAKKLCIFLLKLFINYFILPYWKLIKSNIIL